MKPCYQTGSFLCNNCGVDSGCPSCLVVHTHTYHQGSSHVPSRLRGAPLGVFFPTSVHRVMGFHRSSNPRSVPQQGLAHDHWDEFIPTLHPSSPFQSSLTIISRIWCRTPWPDRKPQRQCGAVSQLLQLCRKRPTLLSSLTAASCWVEEPFWGTRKCRWTAARTPGCRRKSTHLSYSQFCSLTTLCDCFFL